jgi:hypothetical protein
MTLESRNYNEGFLWNVIAEVFKSLPDNYTLIEDVHGGGQQDCLRICDKNTRMEPIGIFHRNRGMKGIHFTTFPDGFYTNTSNRELYRFDNSTCLSPSSDIEKCGKDILAMIDSLAPLPEISKNLEAKIYSFVGAVFFSQLLSDSQWTCRGLMIDKNSIQNRDYEDYKAYPLVENILKSYIKNDKSASEQMWTLNNNNNPLIAIELSGRITNADGVEIMLSDNSIEDALDAFFP